MSVYKPVNYVIFDMDGLLLDSEILYTETFTKVLARYGANYTDDVRVKVMGTIAKDTYTTFINDFKLPVSLETLTEEIAAELSKIMHKAQLLPGAKKLVTHLKKHNIPIAVATSSGKETFLLKTKNHKEVFDLFHHIVIGSSDPEVKRGKPAPDIFLICASRFPEKPSPSECLVFEDAPGGVQGAVEAGMQVVMVPDSLVPEEKRKLATKVISSLLEFKPEEFGLPKFEIK